MLNRLRAAGLVLPTLLASLVLGALLALGSWQMQRKFWKDGLLAQIAARASATPVPLETVLGRLRSGRDVEYTRVMLRGRFLHAAEQYVYVPFSGGQGYHVHTPLRSLDGTVVLVNRGLVPDAMKDPARRADGQVDGVVSVVGLIRQPGKPGTFTPPADIPRSVFYFPDLAGMSAALKQQGVSVLAPVIVDAVAESANPGGWPRGGTTNMKLANRHFEYAVTWYGLAATLIGVYLAFAAGRLKDATGGVAGRL